MKIKMNKTKGIIAFIISLAVLAFAGYVIMFGIGDRGQAKYITQGLDLKGGVSITYQVAESDKSNLTADTLEKTRAKLEKRIAAFSTEATAYKAGEDRITVEIPGAYDADEVLNELGKPGILYFCTAAKSGYTPTKAELKNKKYIKVDKSYYQVWLTGDTVASAEGQATTNDKGVNENIVNLQFNSEGTKAFGEMTSSHVGEQSFIIYDDEVLSAPKIQAAITGGQAQITGDFTLKEAQTLATNIGIGSLEVQLDELSHSVQSANLGSDALSKSIQAGIVGFIIIILFLLFVYRIPGLAAGLALVSYIELMLLALNGFDLTLTLPGIAGIILSVGMGVDGNVLSAERIREELKAGRTIDGAIKNGFQRGFTAILDSNLTVIIVAVILMLVFGTAFGASTDGTIFSFGFTLLVGVIMNFIMACWATRMMTTSLSRFKCFKKPWLYGGEKKAIIPTAAETAAAPAPAVPTNVGKDFVSKRKIFVIISSSIIVLTIIFTFVLGVKVDIRFKGGSMLTYSYSGEIGDAEMSTVKSAIAEIGNVPEVNVTTGTSFTGGLNTMVVSFAADEKMDDEMLNSINAAVEGALPDNAVENIDTTNVSASSGSSFFVSCLVAVVAAFILLAVYIAFRFQKIGGLSAGIIAIICLLHDVAITYAVYVFGGMTLDSNFMAVILTLLGYSINNTIIIYDRLRENRAKYGTKLTDTQLVNLSINQTMPRSIITTATTVCAMVSVSIVCALMGTTSILTFSIPLAIGMLVGFYSSVCLAGPIWIWVQEKRSKKTA